MERFEVDWCTEQGEWKKVGSGFKSHYKRQVFQRTPKKEQGTEKNRTSSLVRIKNDEASQHNYISACLHYRAIVFGDRRCRRLESVLSMSSFLPTRVPSSCRYLMVSFPLFTPFPFLYLAPSFCCHRSLPRFSLSLSLSFFLSLILSPIVSLKSSSTSHDLLEGSHPNLLQSPLIRSALSCEQSPCTDSEPKNTGGGLRLDQWLSPRLNTRRGTLLTRSSMFFYNVHMTLIFQISMNLNFEYWPSYKKPF